ncbi:MAG: hypothetical protein K2X86_14755 [Cytophagaceae bacterium]|nr:hypothetical protein [Cytophagaceae bacterium]
MENFCYFSGSKFTLKHLRLFLLLFLSLYFSSSKIQASIDVIPDTVKIGSYIISIHDINFHNKEYTSRFWLWMLYNNPDFDFVQQVEVPHAKTMEKPDVIVDTLENNIWVLMKMKCIMKQSWEVTDYPFDKQELNLHVENTLFDARSLVFKADTAGSKYDPNLAVDGWHITDFKVSTGINPYNTAFGDPSAKKQYSEYASFNIMIRLERSAWGLFLKIFLGMYIAFFIAVVSFIIRPENVDPRFGLPVGGLFAAVGNKYIIDSLLPESSTFTLVDSLHTVTFLFIFFMISISAISLVLLNRGKPNRARRFDHIGALVVVCGYVLINIIMVGMAIIH